VKRGDRIESDAVPTDLQTMSTDNGATAPGAAPPTGPVTVAPPPFPQPIVAGGAQRYTSLSIVQAQSEAVRLLPLAGIQIKGHSPGQVHGVVVTAGQPNWVIAVLLIIFCVVPAVIYLLLSSRPRHYACTLHFAPSGPGTMITIQAGNGIREQVQAALGALPW
jgi:hypothetical protein